MAKYTSLSELLQGYSTKGPGDAVDSLVAGVKGGMDVAGDREAKRIAFQQKLRDQGILQDKNDIDRMQANTQDMSARSKIIPASATGVDSLKGLDQGVDVSVLNAATKASAKPSFRAQDKGSLADGRLVVFDPSKTQRFVVGKDGSTEIYDQAVHGEINPVVKPALPASDVEKNVSLDTLSNQTENLKALYKPEYVGPVDSVVTGLKQKFGPGATPQAGQFQQAAKDIQDTIARLRSGGQITVDEMKGLLQLVPNEHMSEPDFKGRLDQFVKTVNQIREARKSGFAEAGYRTQGLSDSAQTSQAHPATGTPAPGTKRTRTLKSGKVVVEEE